MFVIFLLLLALPANLLRVNLDKLPIDSIQQMLFEYLPKWVNGKEFKVSKSPKPISQLQNQLGHLLNIEKVKVVDIAFHAEDSIMLAGNHADILVDIPSLKFKTLKLQIISVEKDKVECDLSGLRISTSINLKPDQTRKQRILYITELTQTNILSETEKFKCDLIHTSGYWGRDAFIKNILPLQKVKSIVMQKVLQGATDKVNFRLEKGFNTFQFPNILNHQYTAVDLNVPSHQELLEKLIKAVSKTKKKDKKVDDELNLKQYHQIGQSQFSMFVEFSQIMSLYKFFRLALPKIRSKLIVEKRVIILSNIDLNITLQNIKFNQLDINFKKSDLEFKENKMVFNLRDFKFDMDANVDVTKSIWDFYYNKRVQVQTWKQRFGHIIPRFLRKFKLNIKKTFKHLKVEIYLSKAKKSIEEACGYLYARQFCPIVSNNLAVLNHYPDGKIEYLNVEVKFKNFELDSSDSHIKVGSWNWTLMGFIRRWLFAKIAQNKSTLGEIISKLVTKVLLKSNAAFNFGSLFSLNPQKFLVQMAKIPKISCRGIDFSLKLLEHN